jgi:hypothetical protein
MLAVLTMRLRSPGAILPVRLIKIGIAPRGFTIARSVVNIFI